MKPNDETNNANEHDEIKNPNRQEELNYSRVYWETTPA